MRGPKARALAVGRADTVTFMTMSGHSRVPWSPDLVGTVMVWSPEEGKA